MSWSTLVYPSTRSLDKIKGPSTGPAVLFPPPPSPAASPRLYFFSLIPHLFPDLADHEQRLRPPDRLERRELPRHHILRFHDPPRGHDHHRIEIGKIGPQIGKGGGTADKPRRQGFVPRDSAEDVLDHHRIARPVHLFVGPERPVRINLEPPRPDPEYSLDIRPERMVGNIRCRDRPGSGRPRPPRIPERRIEPPRSPPGIKGVDLQLLHEEGRRIRPGDPFDQGDLYSRYRFRHRPLDLLHLFPSTVGIADMLSVHVQDHAEQAAGLVQIPHPPIALAHVIVGRSGLGSDPGR